MQTIAIVNQKGGVGKSTTAVNLGAGLTRQGKRVLLIDADSQANLTEMLGWQQPDELSPTLATMLERIISDRPIEPQNGILHHKEGMDLLPANIELSGLEVSLVNTMSRETVLRTYLNEVKRQYDYILVDCSPSLGMLTLNALTAADRVIIPVQSHYLPVKGLEQLLRTVSKVQRQLNSNLKISGMEIRINREVRNYHESIFFGLSARQFGCSLGAVAVAVGAYFLLKDPIGKENASWLCMLCAAPLASAGFFKYNGLTFERLLWAMFKTHILCAGRRLYKSENLYDKLLHTPTKKGRKRK